MVGSSVMRVDKKIFASIEKLIHEKCSWKDFAEEFSKSYFDEKCDQEISSLDEITIDFFGEINDLIEYTDDISSEGDRTKYGLVSPTEAKDRLLKVIQHYENKGLKWK